MGPQRMYGLTPWVRRLLVANLLVFLVQSTLLTSPSFAGAFGFSPARAWQYPWTFVTYMFLHAGIPHILFNMLVLFVFGSSVEDRMGGRLFLLFYLLCGIGEPHRRSSCGSWCPCRRSSARRQPSPASRSPSPGPGPTIRCSASHRPTPCQPRG